MIQYQKIEWDKIPKRYFVKVPNRLMLRLTGYYRTEILNDKIHGMSGEYEVFYDSDYVAHFIAHKIIKPLQITRPQAWDSLSSEAYDVHKRLNLAL